LPQQKRKKVFPASTSTAGHVRRMNENEGKLEVLRQKRRE
jgi:hypothetical protein